MARNPLPVDQFLIHAQLTYTIQHGHIVISQPVRSHSPTIEHGKPVEHLCAADATYLVRLITLNSWTFLHPLIFRRIIAVVQLLDINTRRHALATKRREA
jgi:hypothetical protein